MIFLRPWWLCALLIPLLWFWHSKNQTKNNPWKKWIAPDLLKALEVKNSTHPQKQKLFLPFLIWVLWTIAASGPAWYKLPVPATVSATNTAIIMDLSPDYDANTIKKLQLRLYDTLEQLKTNRVALILFGSSQGYTAMPLTPDIQLIQNLIPNLTPQVLPEPSINPKLGLQQAEEILNHSNKTGRILFISSAEHLPKSRQYPTGQIDLTNNITQILNTTTADATSTSNTWDKQADVWADMGIWFIIISLPLFILLFRKNVFFVFIPMVFISPAYAEWFHRPDQIQYQDEVSGVSAYRNQAYDQAEKLFTTPYNIANALAQQGKIAQAIEQYKQALLLDPTDADAKFNKEYLEKQIPPQEQSSPQQQEQNQDKQKSDTDSSNTPDSSDKTDNNSESEFKSSENKPEQNAAEPESQSSQPTQDQTQTELEQALADQPSEEPFNQQEQQILNRLNRDPARVLRYRLLLQHQRKGN